MTQASITAKSRAPSPVEETVVLPEIAIGENRGAESPRAGAGNPRTVAESGNRNVVAKARIRENEGNPSLLDPSQEAVSREKVESVGDAEARPMPIASRRWEPSPDLRIPVP